MANDLTPTQAGIHEFFPHPVTGEVSTDEFGEPLLGFYFQLENKSNEPVSTMVGPYSSSDECEAAAMKAWEHGDYFPLSNVA